MFAVLDCESPRPWQIKCGRYLKQQGSRFSRVAIRGAKCFARAGSGCLHDVFGARQFPNIWTMFTRRAPIHGIGLTHLLCFEKIGWFHPERLSQVV